MSFIFDTYRDDVMALCRSIVIKFDIQNELINERVAALGYPVDQDPKTWKYHLNLNGEYHRNDARMEVISSDTQQRIYFSKRTLEKHPRTRADFAIGSSFYNQLVEKYPQNRILIRGIVKPIDMNKIINSPDFTILDYDSTYIAENETSLMSDLQEWVTLFAKRWFNKDFIISDPLYPAAFFFTLHAYLPTAIMNIRLKYAKTPQAAQFHIWNYLAGHYEIDKYRAYLSNSQALWLYRNIVDIRSRAGRTDRLRMLLTNLLKPAGIGLERTEFIQTASNLIESGKPVSYFSFTEFDSKEIDFSSGSLFNNRNILELTKGRALDNSNDLETDLLELNDLTTRKLANRNPTKLMRAYEDGSVVSQTLETVNLKMVYWVYLSSFGIFNPEVAIKLPKGESKILNWRDAFILFIHALNKSRSVNVKNIPEIEVKGVVPLAYPTKNQLLKLIDNYNVTIADIDYVLSSPIDVLRIKNFSDFDKLIGNVVERRIQHELYWESKKTPLSRSMTESLCKGTWTRVKCVLAPPGTSFEDWLGMQRIADAEISEREWFEIAQNIMEQVIGLEQVAGEMGLRQSAMVDIVERLTSLNVTFIRTGNSKRSRKIEIPNIQLYNMRSLIEDHYDVNAGLQVLEPFTTMSYQTDIDIDLSEDIHYDDSVFARFDISEGDYVAFNDQQTLKRYMTGAEAHTSFKEA